MKISTFMKLLLSTMTSTFFCFVFLFVYCLSNTNLLIEYNHVKLHKWALRKLLDIEYDFSWRRYKGREFQSLGAAKENALRVKAEMK